MSGVTIEERLTLISSSGVSSGSKLEPREAGLLPSNPPPTPNNSSSSSSSTRSSLRRLPLVKLLAIEPALRRLLLYRFFHARPMPKPLEATLDVTEEAEDLRARIRSSMALSNARASCATSALSRVSSSVSEGGSSNIMRRRPHSSSCSATFDEWSEAVGDTSPV